MIAISSCNRLRNPDLTPRGFLIFLYQTHPFLKPPDKMCILTGGEYDCCSSSKEGLPENGKQASYYNNLNQARTWEVRTRDANTAHLFP